MSGRAVMLGTQQRSRTKKKQEKIRYKLTCKYSKIEFKEIWSKLRAKSPLHQAVLDTIYTDQDVYTQKERLNKSRVCNLLEIKPKELNDVIKDVQAALGTPVRDKKRKKKQQQAKVVVSAPSFTPPASTPKYESGQKAFEALLKFGIKICMLPKIRQLLAALYALRDHKTFTQQDVVAKIEHIRRNTKLTDNERRTMLGYLSNITTAKAHSKSLQNDTTLAPWLGTVKKIEADKYELAAKDAAKRIGEMLHHTVQKISSSNSA